MDKLIHSSFMYLAFPGQVQPLGDQILGCFSFLIKKKSVEIMSP